MVRQSKPSSPLHRATIPDPHRTSASVDQQHYSTDRKSYHQESMVDVATSREFKTNTNGDSQAIKPYPMTLDECIDFFSKGKRKHSETNHNMDSVDQITLPPIIDLENLFESSLFLGSCLEPIPLTTSSANKFQY